MAVIALAHDDDDGNFIPNGQNAHQQMCQSSAESYAVMHSYLLKCDVVNPGFADRCASEALSLIFAEDTKAQRADNFALLIAYLRGFPADQHGKMMRDLYSKCMGTEI